MTDPGSNPTTFFRRFAPVFGFVGIVLVLTTTMLVSEDLQKELRVIASQAVQRAMPEAIVALSIAVLGWLLWRVLIRKRPRRSRHVAVAEHCAIAAVFSAALALTIFVIAYIVRPEAALSYIRNDDVIWQFAYGFVIYVAVAAAARASRTRAELKEREFAAAGAELQALRARLDPHFLFNTLHSLTQLAREDPDATETALERFGELMRYVLNAGRGAAADVAIEDELAFVRNYLALEHLRLGERLRVIENVDADTLELAVPPLSLQPLVENAVRHGIGPRREPGTIRLDIRVAEDMLEIAVTDDGKGSDPESVRHSEGLGLQGVRRQIEARFPGRSRFDIATAPGAGFAVRMTMPALLPGR